MLSRGLEGRQVSTEVLAYLTGGSGAEHAEEPGQGGKVQGGGRAWRVLQGGAPSCRIGELPEGGSVQTSLANSWGPSHRWASTP